MANQPFFPSKEGDQAFFFNNIKAKIAGYYTRLDIGTARQAKIQLVLAWLIWTWQTFMPTRRADGPAATAWRNQLIYGEANPAVSAEPPVPVELTPPTGTPFFGMLSWLFEEIGRWKKAEGYVDTIGMDLGIIGSVAQQHTDPPQLTLGTLAQNIVELLFCTYEHGGVWIECQRQGETAFSFLATDTGSPYVDNRPLKVPGLAEWRDYRACWWDNDSATLVFGPTLRVVVGA